MAKQYFEVPSWWKKPEAINYAKEHNIEVLVEKSNGKEKLMLERKFLPEKFSIEGETIYEGYHQLMNDWNGWEQPYFTEEVGKKVISDLLNAGETGGDCYYKGSRFENGKFTIVRNEEDYEDEIIEPETIEVDGKEITVYCFGLGWIWGLDHSDELSEEEREDNRKYSEFLHSLSELRYQFRSLKKQHDELSEKHQEYLMKDYPFHLSFDEAAEELSKYIKTAYKQE